MPRQKFVILQRTYRLNLVKYTANILNVIFTVFKCVPISTVISLYGLHLIANVEVTIKKPLEQQLNVNRAMRLQ